MNKYLKDRDKELCTKYLSLLKSNSSSLYLEIEKLILYSRNKSLIESTRYLLDNIKSIVHYHSLDIYNVAIIGTMSSGKSTFLNALLEKDIIPSKNEACTAKITSISDNDSMRDKIFAGALLDNNKYLFSDRVTFNTLENWNSNDDINHVFLELDIKNIHSKKGILSIHDTPGPNNSNIEKHGLITKDYLENNNIDMFLYLINSEHSSTQDNYNFLTYLYNILNENTKILFLLNKVDSFDLKSNDSIDSLILNTKKEIESIGFKNPIIIPISSNSARLFTKALYNDSFTIKEMIDLRIYFKLFSKNENFNLQYYCDKEIIDEYIGLLENHNNNLEDNIIIIDDESYNRKDLLNALEATNINLIKYLINKMINN